MTETHQEAMMADAEDAARKEVDPDRLLPGEVEESLDRAEIERWARNYEDLLEFKRELLRDIRSRLDGRPPEVRREIEDVDIVALEAQVERIRRRRDFWRDRLRS